MNSIGGGIVDVDNSVFIGKGNILNFLTSSRSPLLFIFELLTF